MTMFPALLYSTQRMGAECWPITVAVPRDFTSMQHNRLSHPPLKIVRSSVETVQSRTPASWE